jgi:hypothetical protein
MHRFQSESPSQAQADLLLLCACALLDCEPNSTHPLTSTSIVIAAQLVWKAGYDHFLDPTTIPQDAKRVHLWNSSVAIENTCQNQKGYLLTQSHQTPTPRMLCK